MGVEFFVQFDEEVFFSPRENKSAFVQFAQKRTYQQEFRIKLKNLVKTIPVIHTTELIILL